MNALLIVRSTLLRIKTDIDSIIVSINGVYDMKMLEAIKCQNRCAVTTIKFMQQIPFECNRMEFDYSSSIQYPCMGFHSLKTHMDYKNSIQ